MQGNFKVTVAIVVALLVTVLAVSPVFVIPAPSVLSSTSSSSGLLELTSGLSTNLDPVFSPNGLSIAYSSNKNDGDFHIWLMTSDGNDQYQLTFLPGNQRYPQWSPNGKEVAFLTTTENSSEIWVANVQTKALTRASGNTYTNDTTFNWNPSGTFIVYDAIQDGSWQIFETNTQTWKTVQLTQVQGNNRCPSWTVDGNSILFSSNRDGPYKIYEMNPSGSDPKQLTFGSTNDSNPIMSPNGEYVAYTSNSSSGLSLWLTTSNGNSSFPVQSDPLRQKPGLDFSPEISPDSHAIWRPDSKALLYNDIDSDLVIFYMNVTVIHYNGASKGSVQQGDSLVYLSNGPINQIDPSWEPNGDAIVSAQNQTGALNLYLQVFVSSTPNPYG